MRFNYLIFCLLFFFSFLFESKSTTFAHTNYDKFYTKLEKIKKQDIKDQNKFLKGLKINQIQSLDDIKEAKLKNLPKNKLKILYLALNEDKILKISDKNCHDNNLILKNKIKADLITKLFIKKDIFDGLLEKINLEKYENPLVKFTNNKISQVNDQKSLINFLLSYNVKDENFKTIIAKYKNSSNISPQDVIGTYTKSNGTKVDITLGVFLLYRTAYFPHEIPILDKLISLNNYYIRNLPSKIHFPDGNEYSLPVYAVKAAIRHGELSSMDRIGLLRYLNTKKVYISSMDKRKYSKEIQEILDGLSNNYYDEKFFVLRKFNEILNLGTHYNYTKTTKVNSNITNKEYQSLIDETNGLVNFRNNNNKTNFIKLSTSINNLVSLFKSIINVEHNIFKKDSELKIIYPNKNLLLFKKLEFRKRLLVFILKNSNLKDIKDFEKVRDVILNSFVIQLANNKNNMSPIHEQYVSDSIQIICSYFPKHKLKSFLLEKGYQYLNIKLTEVNLCKEIIEIINKMPTFEFN